MIKRMYAYVSKNETHSVQSVYWFELPFVSHIYKIRESNGHFRVYDEDDYIDYLWDASKSNLFVRGETTKYRLEVTKNEN